MKTRKRKGFTLVELLVVIAILAILATVSILGYTSFTKKAKISNDESLVLQLNTALQGEEIIDGKPATAHAAVLLLYEQGIKFDELKLQTDGYHLVYDIENNRFGIIDNNNKASYQDASKKLSSDKIDLFVFVNNGDTLDSFAGYSVYLAKDFVPTNATLSTAAGFDAGYNTSITKVTIANANDVDIVVRTNGGDLVIAVPAGDVNVYGVADKITVQKSATASTHICDAVVSELVVNTDDANDHVEVESGAMVAIVKAKKGDVTVESGASIFYLESTGATVEIKNSSDVAKCYDSASKVTGFTGTKEENQITVDVKKCAHAETKTHTVNGTKCTVCTACGKVTATETTKGEEAAEKTDPVNPTPSDPTPTVDTKKWALFETIKPTSDITLDFEFTCGETTYCGIKLLVTGTKVTSKPEVSFKYENEGEFNYESVYQGSWTCETRVINFEENISGDVLGLMKQIGGILITDETISQGTYENMVFVNCTINGGEFNNCEFSSLSELSDESGYTISDGKFKNCTFVINGDWTALKGGIFDVNSKNNAGNILENSGYGWFGNNDSSTNDTYKFIVGEAVE